MLFDQIRNRFIEKFGNAKYEEFVLSLYEAFPLRDRLFFWEEKLLEGLFNDLDFPIPGIEEVYTIFNHCPIHDVELKEDIVPVINGNDYRHHYVLSEEKRLFPLANLHASRDLDRFKFSKTVTVLYCSYCRVGQLQKSGASSM